MILVADNSPDYCLSVQALLETEGYEVAVARTVAEATTVVDTARLDAALVDLRLTQDEDEGDVSGLQVVTHATAQGVPCIVLTAFPSVEVATMALARLRTQFPALGFVCKRDGPEAVLEELRRVPSLYRFGVLHLSDLHFASPKQQLRYDQGRSLRTLAEDLTRIRMEHGTGSVQAVVVTGDMVYKARAQGFVGALSFLQDLSAQLRLETGRVVIVPGNHDINRVRARAQWELLRQADRKHHPLSSKLEEYLAFVEHFYGEAASDRGTLHRIFHFGPVVVVALNSCVREGNPMYRCPVCPREHYHGWIGKDQLGRALADLESVLRGRRALKVAVFHHHIGASGRSGPSCPRDSLRDYETFVKYALAEAGVRVVLHGHGHKVQLRQSPTPGSSVPLLFGSGTVLATEEGKTRIRKQYLMLDFACAPASSRVIMRKYEPSRGDELGGWTADSSIRLGGVLRLPSDLVLPPRGSLSRGAVQHRPGRVL